ncbi:MAG: ATP-dependent RecD-like DNA helicase [Clostridia bacterium]|nr:ATP-dependent RecD-like DNA helicase [Clostridia bacterium]
MEENRLEGQVSSVVFKNEQTGYTVARIKTNDGETVTAVGNMPGLGAGEYINAGGEFIMHPQYGRQFSVAEYERAMPTAVSAIYEYLAAGTVKGIGAKTALMIVERFGEKSFEIIASNPRELTKIRSISFSRALGIQQNYLKAGVLRAVIEFLAAHRLPQDFAAPLFKRFGGDAVSVLCDDPYILCEDPFGLSFHDADRLASDLGIDGESFVRLCAALLYELYFNLQSGHVFLPAEKLIAAASELCGAEKERFDLPLSELCERGRIVREDVGGTDACYLSRVYGWETSAARNVRRLISMKVEPPRGLLKLLEKEEKESGMTYAPLQREAILQCFEHGVSIITGGPGTGKTTALLTLINMFDACGYLTGLAAPTGRAADRMGKICRREAKTLHRLLETSPDESGEMSFKRNAQNPLPYEVVVVDEASMMDLFMSASLLDALKPGARLVLVGDGDQLPPVGAGRFFCDLLESGEVCFVKLTEIFRQAQKSDIIVNAHKIHRGETPNLYGNEKDFYFSACRTAQSTAKMTADLLCGRITEKFGIEPSEIQVICPSRRNTCGTESMNALLQEKLNPPAEGKPEVKYRGASFRLGDRVMQIKNDYEREWADDARGQTGAGVFNGDTGTIARVDERAKTVTVVFDGKSSEYAYSELSELEHAFAVTVHKSQGSEYKAVVIPVFDCPQRLLVRNLLYTAVTRAKELLVICGREDMLNVMVKTSQSAKRYGAFKRRLKGL